MIVYIQNTPYKSEDINILYELLLKLFNCLGLREGDGFDFDWEHFSADLGTRQQRIKGMADIMIKLRKKFDEDPALRNKIISYTPRYNAFFDSNHYRANTTFFSMQSDSIF